MALCMHLHTACGCDLINTACGTASVHDALYYRPNWYNTYSENKFMVLLHVCYHSSNIQLFLRDIFMGITQ